MRNTQDQCTLLHQIGIISFALTDMALYLDTHPHDEDALDFFNRYNHMNHRLRTEYSQKYGPLEMSYTDDSDDEWKWSLQPMPWEGGES